MRISMGHVDEYDERVGAFARQLGLPSVQMHTPSNLHVDADGYWPLADLLALRQRCADDGLALEGLENVPMRHFVAIQRGLPERDSQIELFHTALRNMAAAGIPLLGYNFLPTYVWRTDMAATGRGGAVVTRFELADAGAGNALAAYKLTPSQPVDPPLDADAMWANHRYFLDAVLPVAEEAGVRLALHPDDPPVAEPLGGAARIFATPDGLERAWEAAGGSPAWGLNLCLGTVSEMAGMESVTRVIEYFGSRDAIAYVHFRDVQGTGGSFTECFLGEGNMHVPTVIRLLHEWGFRGFLIDDHVPAMSGDLDTWRDTSSQAYCSRGRAHAIGYLQGVIDALGVATPMTVSSRPTLSRPGLQTGNGHSSGASANGKSTPAR
jgi:mannonate dehydratase